MPRINKPKLCPLPADIATMLAAPPPPPLPTTNSTIQQAYEMLYNAAMHPGIPFSTR
jgi:hypothetical protein